MQRLLVVEDDLVISQLLERFLTDEDFLVDVVSDGRRAVEAIERDPPALVLLDKRLPGLDGIDVCQAVRPSFKEPILMLTANDDDLTEVAALNAGVDDYLSKPVKPYVLLARIRALFGLNTSEKTDKVLGRRPAANARKPSRRSRRRRPRATVAMALTNTRVRSESRSNTNR